MLEKFLPLMHENECRAHLFCEKGIRHAPWTTHWLLVVAH
jgi:hypothetical protein